MEGKRISGHGESVKRRAGQSEFGARRRRTGRHEEAAPSAAGMVLLPSALWLRVRTVLERRVVRAEGGIALHCDGGAIKDRQKSLPRHQPLERNGTADVTQTRHTLGNMFTSAARTRDYVVPRRGRAYGYGFACVSYSCPTEERLSNYVACAT